MVQCSCLPGFTGLKNTQQSSEIIHATTLCCKCFVLFIRFFLVLRLTYRKRELSHERANAQNLSLHTSLKHFLHILF